MSVKNWDIACHLVCISISSTSKVFVVQPVEHTERMTDNCTPVQHAEHTTDNSVPVQHVEHVTDNPEPEDQDGSVTSISTNWECEFVIRATPPLESSSPPSLRMPTNFIFLSLTSYIFFRVDHCGVFHPR